jgi:hypothetical protein
VDAEEDEQRDHDDADHTAADHERQLVLADPERALVAPARTATWTTALTGLPWRLSLLLPPALLLTGLLRPLAPRLLLVRTTLLRLLTPALRLTLLTALPWLRTPPTLLRRLPVRRLAVSRLTVRGLPVGRLALRRVSLVRRLSPSAALRRRLLSPTTLLRSRLAAALRRLLPALVRGLLPPAALLVTRLRRLLAALLRRTGWPALAGGAVLLSPVLPARLAPRLPRTPWSLRRRRHICSF